MTFPSEARYLYFCKYTIAVLRGFLYLENLATHIGSLFNQNVAGVDEVKNIIVCKCKCKCNVKHRECLRDHPSQRLMIKCKIE